MNKQETYDYLKQGHIWFEITEDLVVAIKDYGREVHKIEKV